MLRITSGGLALLGYLLISVSPALSDEPRDERLRFLASALDNPVAEIEKADIALPFLLDTLGVLVSAPGYEKDPSKKVTIICDVDAFKRENMEFDFERMQIRFHSKMINVRLDTILDVISQQINGVVFVRHDNIEIIPRGKAARELGLQLTPDAPTPALVNRFFTKAPLEKALQQLSERYNQNIVLSPVAEAKGATPITARLTNAPIDAAIETLADMADLEVVRKSNIWYVTTREQAVALRADKAKKATKPKKLPAQEKPPAPANEKAPAPAKE